MPLTKEKIAEIRAKGPDAPHDGGLGIYGDNAREILDSHEALRKEAIKAWECARLIAIQYGALRTEDAADEALEKLNA